MSKHKRLLTIIYSALSILLLVAACYILVGYIIAEKQGKPFEYFGCSLHVIATDSMSPELEVGDMIFVKSVKIESVTIGDDVLFKSDFSAHKGYNILHRVVAVESINGIITLTTRGIKSGAVDDEYLVTEILGIRAGSSQIAGQIYLLATTPSGWLVFAVIIFAVVIIVKTLKNIFRHDVTDKTEE